MPAFRLRFLSVAAVAAVVVGTAAEAPAHPHVWIDATATLHFDRARRLVAVEARWAFDDFYSALVVEGMPQGRDGTVPASALKPMADDNVRQLKDWGYFTVLRAGEDRVPLGPVAAYTLRHASGGSITQSSPQQK